MPESPPEAVLVVAAALLDRVSAVVDAAGAGFATAGDAAQLRERWGTAALVLVAVDALEGLPALPRRSGVVLVTADPDDAGIWRSAVGIGAEHVAVLPEAEPWLVERCTQAAGPSSPALTVGVLGGRGGAGASVLAAVLADQAVQAGHRAALVDGDPLGGGLDLLLAAEDVPGLRWGDLVTVQGRVAPAPLLAALPTVDGVPVLAWARGPGPVLPPEAARAVLAGLGQAVALVVLDLPRAAGDATADPTASALLRSCDLVLLVVPGELRAAAGAARLADHVAAVVGDVRLVVRGPTPGALPPEQVAMSVGLPLTAELPPEPGVAAALERGIVPGRSRRSPLGRLARALLEDMLAGRRAP